MNQILFNRPYKTGKELHYIADSHLNNQLSGDGRFTKRCHAWLQEQTKSQKALLTHSCTAALEMAAILLDINPGDEIIMPSYTFVSTANAFVLQGGKPVFVDIREDTLNLNEQLIEAAITSKTKAIVPVHYAGVACEMDAIMDIAKRHDLRVVEDAAQGVMASYKGNTLGGIGDLGAYSFHETKNIISGEGGALLVNNPDMVMRAEIIREKGTNRSRFLRGEVDKYTWQDVGSSFLPSDMIAAFLWAQLEDAENITQQRLLIWNYYHQLLESLETKGVLRRPIVPPHCNHNAHIYYVLLAPEVNRHVILSKLKEKGIFATSHYVPLHSSEAGLRFGTSHGSLALTESLSERILRLPLWVGLTSAQQEMIVEHLSNAISN
ncbi:dTDP-4-amino-4,6-dideoxygalactose transaminase [Legionella sp. PC997]|uniref:dTDP-4-amino-4,6-dideoxygalactose transaminase n=1 Tax=Legionella sp. PC997 TaxID=2755562 RepID=UPI0015F89B69|nr:dTDP-4-amino-4,6-dideoxygalactose transaminase [Legionella sp. PC997]QMT58822.1 DegT/DnrJ/EryC1/StrS family aminotransferase [Legionella sp. PC997]